MPFRSEAQRAYLYLHKPELAKEFAADTPKNAQLPQHVPKKKGPAPKRGTGPKRR